MGVAVWKRSIQVKIGEFFAPCELEIWGMTWKRPLLRYFKLCESFCSDRYIQTRVAVWKLPIRVEKCDFVSCPAWPWNLTDDLEKRALLLSYFKLCASFHNQWSIQTRVTIRKRAARVKIGNFCPVDLEISRMILKNNRAPGLGCFKLSASLPSHRSIQSGVIVWNAQINSKADSGTSASYFKLCVSFCSHVWIQTAVIVRKRPIRVKICDLVFLVTLKFGRWSRKNNMVVFYTISNFMIISPSQSNRKYPIWGKICFDLCEFDLWPLTSPPHKDVNKPENVMKIRWWEQIEKVVTGRQTDRQTHS